MIIRNYLREMHAKDQKEDEGFGEGVLFGGSDLHYLLKPLASYYRFYII